ncbi:hypothetical protein RRF57_000448 [Xylaria bambusicola]|uniref:Uncharacterized protein n=1 Tax=Xylaria bambusicola TaxID=326684 RepID=A0AAN7UA57_9PEZI
MNKPGSMFSGANIGAFSAGWESKLTSPKLVKSQGWVVTSVVVGASSVGRMDWFKSWPKSISNNVLMKSMPGSSVSRGCSVIAAFVGGAAARGFSSGSSRGRFRGRPMGFCGE